MNAEPLPPAELDALVSRAKGVISGTLPIPMLPRDERIEAFLAEIGRENYKPGTIDQMYIDRYYEGQFIATYTNPEGRTAVLACGEQEIWNLIPQLAEVESRQLALGSVDLSVCPRLMFGEFGDVDVSTDRTSNGVPDAVDPTPADYPPRP